MLVSKVVNIGLKIAVCVCVPFSIFFYFRVYYKYGISFPQVQLASVVYVVSTHLCSS